MGEYSQKVMEQDKLITNQNQKIQTLETKVTNLSRIVIELEQKYGDLINSPGKTSTAPKCVCTVSAPDVTFNIDKDRHYSQGSESSGYGSQLDLSSVDSSFDMKPSSNITVKPSKCSKRNHDQSDDKKVEELLSSSPIAKRLRRHHNEDI